MTDSEREVLFRALLGPVDRITDSTVVKQLEEIAAGQLAEVGPVVDQLLTMARFHASQIDAACLLRALGFADVAEWLVSRRVEAGLQTVAISDLRQSHPGGPVGDSLPTDDESRCAVCGWPLTADEAEGCVRGSCSMRPVPSSNYAPERANREYRKRLLLPELEPIKIPPARFVNGKGWL